MTKKPLAFDFRNLLVILFSIFGFCELILQQYNELTWIYLILLGLGLSLFLFAKKLLVLPDKRILYFILFATIVTAIQSILNGSTLLEERWITRYITLFIIFLFYQFFTEEQNFSVLAWPFLGIIFTYCISSLFQYVFLYQTDAKEAFSVFASRFWNISYYAQAISLSLPFISYFKSRNKFRYFLILADSTTLIIFTTLFATQSKTSLISLSLYVAMELFKPIGFSRKKLLGLILFGFLINSGIWHFKTITGQPNIGSKERSFNYRSNLLDASLEMAHDFPTGVGPDRFKSVLNLYYQKDKPLGWEYTDVNKSPHSEALQVLTEDGWAIAAIYAVTVLFVFFVSFKSFFSELNTSIFPRFFICLVPQMAFHFPFDLYFPVFLFALSLSQFLKPTKIEIYLPKSLKVFLTTFAAILFTVLCVREFKIISYRDAIPYCEIFHDNFKICKEYFSEALITSDLVKANDISRPIIKYQNYFYAAIAMDYSVGIEPRSQILSCLYYDLFNGDHKIELSETEKCHLSKSRQEKIEHFTEFAEKR